MGIIRHWLRHRPLQGVVGFAASLCVATSPLGCPGCASEAAQAQELAAPNVSATRPAPVLVSLDEVASQLICDNPHCSKESLSECTTCEYAVRHRNEIAAMLKQGKSKEQILDFFAATYGEQLLGNPRSPWAAAVPFGAVLLGLIPLGIAARSRRRPKLKKAAKAAASTGRPVGDAAEESEDARVAAALRDFDF